MIFSRLLKKRCIFVFFSLALSANAQVVELFFERGSCSGFVGKFAKDSQKAYLFTAGHCVPGLGDRAESDKIISRLNFEKPQKFIVRSAATGKAGFITSQDIIFATFQRIDIGIYSLKESVVELEQSGFPPFLIQTADVSVGAQVRVINPLIGEVASCLVESRPFMLSFQDWHWPAAARLSSQCRLGPGWSGAPVLDTSSGVILGILSGGNDSGNCSDYCEVDEDKNRFAFKNRSYFSVFSFIKPCLGQNGHIVAQSICLP